MPASSTAQSSSVRAIGPAWSRLVASGTTPRDRDSTAGRLDRRRPAQRRRDAQRAGGVGARRRRHQARRRAQPPSRRSSRRPSARATTGCRPGRSSRRPRTRACGGGRAGSCPAARRRDQTSQSTAGCSSSRLLDAVQGPARDCVQILEPDRDAPERRRIGDRGTRLVGPRRRGQRLLLVHAHPGIDRGRIA